MEKAYEEKTNKPQNTLLWAGVLFTYIRDKPLQLVILVYQGIGISTLLTDTHVHSTCTAGVVISSNSQGGFLHCCASRSQIPHQKFLGSGAILGFLNTVYNN